VLRGIKISKHVEWNGAEEMLDLRLNDDMKWELMDGIETLTPPQPASGCGNVRGLSSSCERIMLRLDL
jgi:hypothetical protein